MPKPLRPCFFRTVLGHGAQSVYRRPAESLLQSFEQNLHSLLERLRLEQTGAFALERPECTTPQTQCQGRNRQDTALQSILDEIEQALSLVRRLAQIEAFDRGRMMQMLECDLETANLRLAQLELRSQ